MDKEVDKDEKKPQFSDELLKHVEDTSDIENDDLLGDDVKEGREGHVNDKVVSEDASMGALDDMTGDEGSLLGTSKKRENLLEEAEAISDDDLEALIEEDNEPMGKWLVCFEDFIVEK